MHAYIHTYIHAYVNAHAPYVCLCLSIPLYVCPCLPADVRTHEEHQHVKPNIRSLLDAKEAMVTCEINIAADTILMVGIVDGDEEDDPGYGGGGDDDGGDGDSGWGCW